MDRKVIIIAGPTASGKTGLSLILAGRCNGEIISADSRQIFKHLNTGTAKPSKEELESVKHYFIDELDPFEDYDISIFEKNSLKIIGELMNTGKLPIVSGGSGLYIRALVKGIIAVDKDNDYREELLDMRRKYGNDYLYDRLKENDPAAARIMLPQNWKRVIRALEVNKITGKTIGELEEDSGGRENINFRLYGLMWNRELLYSRIETRVDKMIREGLVEEVQGLLKKGYHRGLNSMNTVGYKEIISYLSGEISLEKSIELIKRNSRRYAKRQITWFKKEDMEWINIKEEEDIYKAADYIIEKEELNER